MASYYHEKPGSDYIEWNNFALSEERDDGFVFHPIIRRDSLDKVKAGMKLVMSIPNYYCRDDVFGALQYKCRRCDRELDFGTNLRT